MMVHQDREEKLLNEINRHLPKDVDWKQGAIDYLEQLIRKEGDHNEIYHLIKPFLGGPDFAPFFDEMYGFLNMLNHIDLPMKSKVLDVACGPGWTSHFLAKLGYDALGVDISEDLIRIAKKRVSLDTLSPYKGTFLTADFLVHDIEEKPLPVDIQYDCAFFESALHHFFDPIAVIKHISDNLREEGILCIWEGGAPKPGSPEFAKNLDIMNRYQTLERPYTRDQLIELLDICGFCHYEFYSQVNGLFNSQNESDMLKLKNQLASGEYWNICIASRTDNFFERKSRVNTFPYPSDQSTIEAKEEVRRLNLIKVLWSALTCSSQKEFVSLLYYSILKREPDVAGLALYLGRPNSFIYRVKMVWSFMNSRERENLKRRST